LFYSPLPKADPGNDDEIFYMQKSMLENNPKDPK
jgi:hypothetical protein